MAPNEHLSDTEPLFKRCSNCRFEWELREHFLSDKNIVVIGYQANFKQLLLGLIYFNHSCGGTITVPAYYFVDLYPGSIFEERVTASDECPEYCLNKESLEPCPAKCECSYIRDVIQIIKDWPKA
jgi:hypothetical protein